MKKIIEWISAHNDKVLHFLFGYLICTVFPVYWTYGLVLSIVAGSVKEYWDSKGNGCVDTWDFVATVCGGIVGAIALSIK